MIHTQSSSKYYAELLKLLKAPKNDQELFTAIVDAPFHDRRTAVSLNLGVTVLLLNNIKTKTIDRIALSNTEQAQGAVDYSVKPFKEIKIPIGYEANAIAKAIIEGAPQKVSDWQYLFIPALSPEEARLNQAGSGIGCSVVHPLIGCRDGGALIFSYYSQPETIGDEHAEFMEMYSAAVAKRLKGKA